MQCFMNTFCVSVLCENVTHFNVVNNSVVLVFTRVFHQFQDYFLH
ncbi:hypothetical protein QF044_001867 [Chryseobacterium sp. W4I1]|nr:hypothetical protein [Chryseobacterium sp. W4I1]